MTAANENSTLRQSLEASLAAVPVRNLPGNSASLASAAARRTFRDELPTEHTRHAWRYPQTAQTIGEPARWIEPSLCRDDAISEARRIAEEVSIFGTGFAWEHCGRWYAADFRAWDETGFGTGGFGERITIEIAKSGSAA